MSFMQQTVCGHIPVCVFAESWSELTHSQGQSTYSTTPFRLIQPHVNSEPCWDLIDTWLNNCSIDHTTCRQNSLAEKPTRLIDVDSVRLVDGLTCDKTQRYAALSHYWGAGRPYIVTTTVNLQQFNNKIYLQAMPQNFQDAIFATRRLNVRYLWIDSLCIIQDDMSDWAHEASKMGNYYRNAFIVLSSLSATNTSTGFL